MGRDEERPAEPLSVVRPVIFTPAARFELIDAQDWYEKEATGLGRRFRTQAEAVVERIGDNPAQFPAIHRTVRRALLRHFPYALLFMIEPDDAVTILACFHGSRDPMRWQRRT